MSPFDELKSVASVLQEAGKIEQYKQILEILQQLLEMQNKIIALETDNKKLKNKLEISAELVYKNNAYWKQDDGPFCIRCWDKNKDLIRLKTYQGSSGAHCPECNNSYSVYPENDSPYHNRAVDINL